MFTTISPLSLSLFLTASALFHLTTAIPSFSDSTVAYLTNCETSDTQQFYSEVSFYNDVTQSFGGQNPDYYDDNSLGATVTWENTRISWSYASAVANQPDTFNEFINANGQDPAVPVNSPVGCGTYTPSVDGGAIAFQFLCSKDQPRQLYATSDHECTTVYYCRITHDVCPFSPPAAAPLIEQSEL